HDRGVLHRDLKPRNVLIDADGQPHVVDFGLAKWRLNDAESTATGALLGSPPYMAPEQVRRASSVTAAADVYSLGATLYHRLAGRPPFAASSVPEVVAQVLDGDPLPVSRLQPGVGRALGAVCMKCLEKAPARRYQSAADLADDLRRYLDGRPVQARPA